MSLVDRPWKAACAPGQNEFLTGRLCSSLVGQEQRFVELLSILQLGQAPSCCTKVQWVAKKAVVAAK